MKTIGIISDTHSFIDERWTKHFSGVDEIWHAGDIGNREVISFLNQIAPVRAVTGNIDDHNMRREFSATLTFEIEKVKVFATHIGGKPGKYNPAARKLAIENMANLFLCGHSHICRVEFDKANNWLFVNPGASGKTGFHAVKTILKLEIDGSTFKNLSVIELP